MEIEPTWQERIEWCRESGMTDEQVASEIGLMYKSFWDLANARTRAPNGMTAVKLHALSEKCRRKLDRARA